jgi:hypothetical protein
MAPELLNGSSSKVSEKASNKFLPCCLKWIFTSLSDFVYHDYFFSLQARQVIKTLIKRTWDFVTWVSTYCFSWSIHNSNYAINACSFFTYWQVDVFSFGIVLWEILTGEEPYANMHYGAIIGMYETFLLHHRVLHFWSTIAHSVIICSAGAEVWAFHVLYPIFFCILDFFKSLGILVWGL